MDKSAAPPEIAQVAIKKEVLNDDIKEFAETAMNELLGWYGYGNDREERSTRVCRPRSGGSTTSSPESPKFREGCGWCGKPVDENTSLSSVMATFCSELCFSQSRRANFKKNKTCDWCRHVRHTVSYVDSQDGASQLQFCSDKCLNQYKMHIFWRETRAHLELHPHLHGEESSSGTLITPDLWMSKCKSSDEPSTSSPSPPPSTPSRPTENHQQTSPLPLITVAHPSKLMSINHQDASEPSRRLKNCKVQKRGRKKNPSPSTTTSTCTSSTTTTLSKLLMPEMPQDLRIRHTPTSNERFENILTNSFATSLTNSATNSTTVTKPDPRPPSAPLPEPRLLPLQNGNNETVTEAGSSQKKFLDGLLPPPTVLVPYPLILPIPIPIPIPIPLPIPDRLFNKYSKDRFTDASSQTEAPAPFETKITEAPETNSSPAVNETTNGLDEVPNEEPNEEPKEEPNEDKEKYPARPLRKRKAVVERKTRVAKKKRVSSM